MHIEEDISSLKRRQAMTRITWTLFIAAFLALQAGCNGGDGHEEDGDAGDVSDTESEDAAPDDTTGEDAAPDDTTGEDAPPPDMAEEDAASEDMETEEEEELPAEVTVVGRVWNYFASGMTVGYDYPWDQVTVRAWDAGTDPLAEALTDIDSCTPWDPPDPYTCGYFEMVLGGGARAMLRATDNYGFKDTLTQIFTARPGTVRIVVMISDDLITLVETTWSVTVDASRGYVAGIVARTSGDVHAEPFTELIADASVEITPSTDFGDDAVLVYYDSSDPSSMDRTSTDPDNPIFIALNIPSRPFDDPYEITVSHPTYSFNPVRFAVQADVLTYLILSPAP
jgi:hypothetical protein